MKTNEWIYYELLEPFAGYPAGCVFLLVESRNWMQYNMEGTFCSHTDGFWIGPLTRDNSRPPQVNWCITRAGLNQHSQMFKRVYLTE